MIDGRVVDKRVEHTSRGRLRALYKWLRPAPPLPQFPSSSASAPDRGGLPARIGPYAIERKLGQGGMGVVYAARDERLKRTVAVKMMSSLANDERARTRFWREARIAASVNHPNVCQIYEISEDHGELFIAMELLEGEALSERLLKGPLCIADALPIEFGILAALSALHARGIVHRDLKPSNVFLTLHSVKLLDFGLARPQPEPSLDTETSLTHSGTVLGTPSYMAPEQVTSGVVDSRCDLFAAGAILFELLAGRRAFGGRTVVDILHATLHEQPPALTGTPAVTAVDRVIRRALAKRPEDRTPSADAMAEELRAIRGVDEGNAAVLARPLTRLVVLPFRVLRPDPETDFLAFSLPDAIATSLSGIGSLIVRSSTTAARFAAETPDLKALAARGRRGPGGHRHAAAFRRPVARRGAARRGPRRDAAHLTYGAVVARRLVPLTRRHRPTRGGSAVAPADGRSGVARTRRAAERRRLRVLPPGERTGPHVWRARQGARFV